MTYAVLMPEGISMDGANMFKRVMQNHLSTVKPEHTLAESEPRSLNIAIIIATKIFHFPSAEAILI